MTWHGIYDFDFLFNFELNLSKKFFLHFFPYWFEGFLFDFIESLHYYILDRQWNGLKMMNFVQLSIMMMRIDHYCDMDSLFLGKDSYLKIFFCSIHSIRKLYWV